MASVTALICGASAALCSSSVNSSAQFIRATPRRKCDTASRSWQWSARRATLVHAFNDASDGDSPSVVPREESASVKGFGAPKAVSADKKKPSKAVSVRRAPPSKPLVGVQADPQNQQTETVIVTSLAVLFTIILLEGVFLAASGFLSDELDQFAVNSVYPAFSPSVGVFLTGSAGYGLWKYLGGGTR